ncbi:MAG: [FeFe] hydrogenase H-cluster radical SAM maturase HydE [Lachnospiraceae bacterium]
MTNKDLINKLEQQEYLDKAQWMQLLSSWTESDRIYAGKKAADIAREQFGNRIFTRGLIEFSSYCRNDCFYCGIRNGNGHASRYRLTAEEILSCCQTGYQLGFRTFVLQGGEDPFFTTDKITAIIQSIKADYPDCALTLSLGERCRADYQEFYNAGADRYLLRHETASPAHYQLLHPERMSLSVRKQCLHDLKDIGFQVGCGFMVGSPGQTPECLAEDFLFIRGLSPHMVGIGPFIPHHDTVFHDEPAGSLEFTLFLLSLIRIMCKNVLLPATTALGTIHPKGREMGILAGANVVMPNLSPTNVRSSYLLYDNKICTGDEAAECRGCLERRMSGIGYRLVTDRGDWQPIKERGQKSCHTIQNP